MDLWGTSPTGLGSPERCFEAWRAHGDLFWSDRMGCWIVTRHEDIVAVLRQKDLWSSQGSGDMPLAAMPGFAEVKQAATADDPELCAFVQMMEGGRRAPVLMSDGAEHARLRAGLIEILSVARVRALTPFITGEAQALVGAMPAIGTVDMVERLAMPLPVAVIGRLLGLADEEQDRFRMIADTLNFGQLTVESARQLMRNETFVRDYFEARLREYAGGPDGALGLLRQRVDDGSLSLAEAAGLCRELVVAGNETTRFLIANALVDLAGRPELQVRARQSAEALGRHVEETLRLRPPFNGFWRRNVRDAEVAGQTLPAGSIVYLNYAGANRDPRAFDRPDVHAEGKVRSPHLAFGLGAHFCVGAGLARLECTIALDALLKRFGSIELDCDPDTLPYLPDPNMQGPLALPLRVAGGRR